MKNYGKQRDREKKYPPLTKEQQKLVADTLWIVKACASRVVKTVNRGSLDFDDLVGYGYFGLCKAALRFDPSKGNKFSTFAYPTCMGAIRHAIRDRSNTVRIPLKTQQQRARAFKLLSEGHTLEEAAKDLKLTKYEVMEALQSYKSETVDITEMSEI